MATTFLLSAFGIFPSTAVVRAEDANTRVASMPYSECLSIIAEAAQELGEAPVETVSNDEETTVRINASDGFVTVSCSRDGKMVLTKSSVPEAAGMTAAR
ncbi:hypothetical protein [Microvirga makkahensis]|uniref:Uncharacterized protein n=1 Tax=Microvirga makkahensis TaxID=1128670 RepID=A0A7X3MWA1_9HYPH|nr:hypothetical protein [Microvirga makkahensis]MXQ14426.1 hypothetical protein [Microvirga makkahensis]